MKITNFERHYVNGFNCRIDGLWKHKNGSVCSIEQDFFGGTNYVFVNFVDGISLTVEFKGSVLVIGLHDIVIKRDLGSHPSWNKSRDTLVKVYMLGVLRNKMSYDNFVALFDIVKSEVKY